MGIRQPNRRTLRTGWLGLLLWPLLTTAAPAAEDAPPEPYRVFIASPAQFARCGPGDGFYKTDPLRPGDEIDVYLETDDGWLGIRPPESSFCWIQSDHIEVAEDETTGIVVNQAAVAWIGTQLGRARQYRWQVRLAPDEQVTIIGTAQREGPSGDEVWYRIVPPAGEFRWVHRDQVVDSLELVQWDDPTSQSGLQGGGIANRGRDTNQRADSSVRAQREDRSAAARDEFENQPIGSGLAANKLRQRDRVDLQPIAESGRPTPPGSRAESVLAGANDTWVGNGEVVPAGVFDQTMPDDAMGSRGMSTQHPDIVRPASLEETLRGPRFHASTDVDQAGIDALRDELSRAMAAKGRASEVEPVRRRAAYLAMNAATSIDRGRAAILVKRIEDYQLVASRRDDASDSASGTPLDSLAGSNWPVGQGANSAEVTETSPESPSRDSESARTGEADRGGRFDRQGWLVRVYSSRTNAPPFAITDSAGRTLSYVTPVPGINLRRYLNQEVGLYGRMAYDTSLETPHLIAEQAVRLRK